MKAYVKQPLPGDTLHTESDDALKFLIKTNKRHQRRAKDNSDRHYKRAANQFIKALRSV